jgi:hypothetical protein
MSIDALPMKMPLTQACLVVAKSRGVLRGVLGDDLFIFTLFV